MSPPHVMWIAQGKKEEIQVSTLKRVTIFDKTFTWTASLIGLSRPCLVKTDVTVPLLPRNITASSQAPDIHTPCTPG